jgi:hypothetical protein
MSHFHCNTEYLYTFDSYNSKKVHIEVPFWRVCTPNVALETQQYVPFLLLYVCNILNSIL